MWPINIQKRYSSRIPKLCSVAKIENTPQRLSNENIKIVLGSEEYFIPNQIVLSLMLIFNFSDLI